MRSIARPDQMPIRSLFFQYYIPALTSMLSITLHQVINGVMLGHYVGKEGVAAVVLYWPVQLVLIAIGLLGMMGGGIMVGRAVGAKDAVRAQAVFEFVTTWSWVVGGVVALVAPFVTQPLARFLAGPNMPCWYNIPLTICFGVFCGRRFF